jgi:hypothetical protein
MVGSSTHAWAQEAKTAAAAATAAAATSEAATLRAKLAECDADRRHLASALHEMRRHFQEFLRLKPAGSVGVPAQATANTGSH